MARSGERIHARSRFHIGGVAYLCMGVSAHTLHEHVEYPTVADTMIETRVGIVLQRSTQLVIEDNDIS